MNSLTVITEELEEEVPDDCPELVQKLMNELKAALHRIDYYEDQLSKVEPNDNKVKELMVMCQSKNAEIFALERKVKDLTAIAEDKDRQIISMLSMAKEFRQLVESEDKAVQVEIKATVEHDRKSAAEEKQRLKEVINEQFEQIERTRVLENVSTEGHYAQGRKKNEQKVKPGGYYPLFLRKPKEGFLSNM